jgi:hypothetical protein
MSNIFVDQVEATASLQYHCEEAIERIDLFIMKVKTMEGISQRDQDALIETLTKMKPLIIQNLVLKAIQYKRL